MIIPLFRINNQPIVYYDECYCFEYLNVDNFEYRKANTDCDIPCENINYVFTWTTAPKLASRAPEIVTSTKEIFATIGFTQPIECLYSRK